MATPQLTERQRRVLQAIVEDYISTAEPVGSRTIARRYVPAASPATIRNDMADLEELGYLEQPHTSAGRIPSDSGYRYYVDHVLEAGPLPEEHSRLVERALHAKMRQLEGLIQNTVRALAEASSLISIVLGPQIEPAALVRVEMTPVDEHRALLALVSDTGFVETRVVELPDALDRSTLRRVADLVNGLLAGHTWSELDRAGLLRELRRELGGCEEMLSQTVEFLRSSLEPSPGVRVYVSGVAKLLDLPEFRDVSRAKAVLALVEQVETLASILSHHLRPEGVQVAIGRENRHQDMYDLSLVSAPYHAGGRVAGGVAVLGPKRMAYRLVLPLVEFVAEHFEDRFQRLA